MTLSNRWNLPDLGLGLGLRGVHSATILRDRPPVDWFEILSENYLLTEGRPLHVLDQIAEHYPVVLHGVSLSIGSTDPLDLDYLSRLKALANRIQAVWMGDHVCWTGFADHNSHDLLPLPYNEQTLRHVVQRIREVQDFLERPLVLENPSTYVTFQDSTMSEHEFLRRMAEDSDCALLLDVNNVYVTCRNHDLDPWQYLDGIPYDRVVQIHIAGHTDKGTHCVDTHSAPVIDPVWEFYDYVHRRTGGRATLLEWDADIPPFEEVFAELQKAAPFRSQAELPPVSDGNELRELQRWMLTLLTHPDGVGAGETAARDRRVLRDRDRVVDRFEASAALTPEQRVGVYAGMYFQRLIESLEMDHAGLRHALGHEEFLRVAQEFAVRHPSTYFTLSRFGARLPGFLERRSATNPPGRFLAELATLERSVIDVFHERQVDALTPDHLQSIPQEQWGNLSLRPIPATRLLALDYPVNSFLDAVKADQTPAIPDREACHVLVHRTNFTVHRHELETEAFVVLDKLFEGHSLEQGLTCALESTRRPTQELLARAGPWFQEWMTWGLFADLKEDAP